MRVQMCPGRNPADLCLGCEAMIPSPFKSLLFPWHHQCPERCLLFLPSSQPMPLHSHPPSPSRKAQIPLAPLPLLISTRCRTHSSPKTQEPCADSLSVSACFHPLIPPKQHQNHELGEDSGLTVLHPAQLCWEARLDTGYWATALLRAGGSPLPMLLSGPTKCPSQQWQPESKGLFPSRRTCVWNAQQTQFKQTTITN